MSVNAAKREDEQFAEANEHFENVMPNREQLIAIARKELTRQKQDTIRNRLHYHYSFINPKGEVTPSFGGCYGNVKNGPRGSVLFTDAPYSVKVNVSTKAELKDIIPEYVSYVTERSVFAPAFINKGGDVWENGAIFDCEYSGAMIIGACMALRNIKEKYVIENWFKFKEHIGEDAAFVASNLFCPYKVFGKELGWTRNAPYSWFIEGAWRGHYKYIIKEKKVKDINSPMKDSLAYSPISRIFNSAAIGSEGHNFPMPKGIKFDVENAFGNTAKIIDNFYPIENMKEWLNDWLINLEKEATK